MEVKLMRRTGDALAWALFLVIALGLAIGGLLVLSGVKNASAQERAALITGLLGFVGIAAAAFQAFLGYLERRRQAALDAIFRELGQFTGGIQKRNVGISMLGHYWNQFPSQEGLFVRILTNQTVYVAAHGELDKAHEFSNMTRMVELLEPVKNRPNYKPFIQEAIDELKRKKVALPQKSVAPSGTRLTQEAVQDWIDKLN
jgi:hypothetical protein